MATRSVVLDDIPGNELLLDDQPLQLELDRWLYASDFHVPLHNREYIYRLISVARSRKIKALVIGGDFYDFDSLSKHPKLERLAGFKRTKAIGGDLLYLLAQVFEEIYILPGNHCRRWNGKLEEAADFSDLVWAGLAGRQPKGKIVTTNYDYIYVGAEESGWVVGHPRYFSTIPARGGAEVAMLKRRNVIGAHNHIQGLMRSKCGRFISIDPGHMCEPGLTPYRMMSQGLSKYPEWTPGFVLIEGNVPRICSDGLVDWAKL